MTTPIFAMAPRRGVLMLAGDDRAGFLQGLVSNDVARVSATRAIHAALLTPQGKFLHDLFVAAVGEALVLDAEAGRLADLKTRLTRFRLRAKVTLAEAPTWAVATVFGPGAAAAMGLGETAGAARAFADGVAYTDPRLAAAGVRVAAPLAGLAGALAAVGLAQGQADDYDRHRLALGLPDGSRDLVIEKTLLLEAGFEDLGGVDFAKGCYMGQELTARTRYRGLVRKRLVPVAVRGALPEPGTPLLLAGRPAGEMRSGRDGRGLALVRIEELREALRTGAPLAAGDAHLVPEIPSWMTMPDGGEG